MKPIWRRPMEDWKEYHRIKESLTLEGGYALINGVSETQKCHLVSGILEPLNKSCIFIAYNEFQAGKVYEDLNVFFPGKVSHFPPREIMLYDAAAHSTELVSRRLSVIADIISGENKIIVASAEALMFPLSPPEKLKASTIALSVGDVCQPQELAQKAVEMGYERVHSVEGKGQFGLRGGIFDIFPLGSEKPWRIEFFDEEIDSIRSFDPMTQRSLEKVMSIVLSPAREVLPDAHEMTRAKAAMEKSLKNILDKHTAIFESERLKTKIGRILEDIDSGTIEDSLYNYYPYFYQKPYTLLDYLDDNAVVVVDEPSRLKENSTNAKTEFSNLFEGLLLKGEVLPEQGNLLADLNDLVLKLPKFRGMILQSLPRSMSMVSPKSVFQIASRTIPSYQGKPKLLADDIKYWKDRDYAVLLLTGSPQRAEGLKNTLGGFGIEGVIKRDDSAKPELLHGQVGIYPGTLNKGFEYIDARFVVVSDNEIFRVRKQKTRGKKRTRKLDPFTDLKKGDYVVHENHGIGKYLGIEKITVNGQTRDYLHVKYAGTDKLYIPTDQMDTVQPYIGMNERPPKLSKLGGTEWQRAKNKVRHSVMEMADDLIKLYAARESAAGFRFSPDNEWQQTFEDMFPYEETPDQLQSIAEIKRDMESGRVMDRLLCGDVGYGKTEVALRAAFKAVMDGKQVAVLAPTTILAQQHYNTFLSRFGDFPFKVEVVSRFRTPADTKKVLRALKEGNVDVIIGTHRILSKDVAFKDLGLLIVDEEQRFGVAHKETIKTLKKNIDVLTLTATPIPRTLHMSLTGIRDISVIETPPEDRYPVQTYVVEYNESLIREAVLREIRRGGQVYYVYNNVKGIERMADRLRALIPEARIAIGHGQMSERTLESIMMGFFEVEYDLLLCSTIIESGLDIPNVNTLIVHDADNFGLSQLYQLRGRVGRSNRVAYAYFTYKRDKILTEVAEKRLQAIKEFTEFGSGFKIAMRDLEIRGSGNLLGAQQHGHLAAVGYEMYTKLLQETLRMMKGEKVEKQLETFIDIRVDAFIDSKYIPLENERIEIYKRIAAIENLKDRYDVEDELEDRFGEIPRTVSNLIGIAYIKGIAKALYISEVSHRDNEIRIKFIKPKALNPTTIMVILNENRNKLKLLMTNPPVLTLRLSGDNGDTVIRETIQILEKIAKLQAS